MFKLGVLELINRGTFYVKNLYKDHTFHFYMMHQEIRATFDKNTITVYQAYPKSIALSAIKNNRFEAPFSFSRMTWIKPSFLWLMARSNWGTKSNQEHTLAIKIKRIYWERALAMGILTHPDATIYSSGSIWEKAFQEAKIHLQWDPERSIRGKKLEIRSIQVGISRHLIEDFNNEWIDEIVDQTALVKKIHLLRKAGKIKEAKRLLPSEKIYPLSKDIQQSIGISK